MLCERHIGALVRSSSSAWLRHSWPAREHEGGRHPGGINHSLFNYWLGKYRDGTLSLDVRREEELVEAERQIAGLERKVGQLTMELDLLKGGSSASPS